VIISKDWLYLLIDRLDVLYCYDLGSLHKEQYFMQGSDYRTPGFLNEMSNEHFGARELIKLHPLCSALIGIG